MSRDRARLYVVAGERSGDAHGAAVLGDLLGRLPDAEVRGLGGAEMHGVSPGVADWVEEAGVLGLWEVLKNYGWFRARMEETVALLREWCPHAVLFIDYPGFNLRLARRLQVLRPGTRLVYYVSPQVWAWNRGRIPRMAALLDRMLCIFPFEKALYEASGLATDFVGHPLVDALATRLKDPPPRERDLVGWFPGSRSREIEKHLPVMLEAAALLGPGFRHVVSAASARVGEAVRAVVGEARLAAPVEVVEGHSRDLMQRCAVGAVASGTATLEAALLGLPHCLVYKVAWPTYWAGRALVRVPHLGMANLLAGRELAPEFLQGDLRPERLASWMKGMLHEPGRRDAMAGDLAAVRAKLGDPGGHARAAEAVAEELVAGQGLRA